MSDLLYSDVETSLRASVRDLLTRRSPVSRVLSQVEAGASYDQALWRTLAAEMGLAGMAVPERLGGGGASLREAAVVVEELGRGLAPVPYLSSAVVATTALLSAGEGGDLLSKLAAGESVAVLAVPLSTAPLSAATLSTAPLSTAPRTPWSAGVTVDDGRLSGVVTSVADALAADVLLVAAGDGLYVVDATADGVTRTPVVSFDLTRPLADVTLTGATCRLLAEGPAAASAVSFALTVGAALLASEQLGVAEWCLDSTVEYVKVRHQFGRPVGSFQAVKHRLADVWVEVTQARAVARYAADRAATAHPDLPVAASLAQAYVGSVAVKAAEEAVQLHGGIGFTWEHPAHLFLKRAKSSAVAFGTADWHRQELATLVNLPS
jgi:alkylation response protein AidB-like acyl-CoA dehydrogenase